MKSNLSLIHHSSFRIAFPLSAVDHVGAARHDDFVVFFPPEDFYHAAGRVDVDAAAGPAVDRRGDGRRAGARARREGLADAALPEPYLDVSAVPDAHEDDVRPVRELL